MADRQDEYQTMLLLATQVKNSQAYQQLKVYMDKHREVLIGKAKLAEPGTAAQARAIAVLEGWDMRERIDEYLAQLVKRK